MIEQTRKYQICSQCIMDITDTEIIFDAHGVCNHCNEFKLVSKQQWLPNDEGHRQWMTMLEKIKEHGRGKDYDCIIGLSGGVDSSYLALKASEWGLRPLVVHVDAGWNSELAVANIEAILKHCNYDLHTHVVDWEEMRDLHLAYLHAGIANQDVPQDHIFFASLYHFATRNNIRYILSGGNLATEGVFPQSWHGSAMDAINLKAIHRKFGQHRLLNYKTINFFSYYFWYPFVKKMRTLRPLNYMPYDKTKAIEELERTVGWRSYGRKHGESQFTKLFQNFYLPTKFGFDKRRPHLSSLIVSGQMTREQALEEMSKPLYDAKELELDIDYFCKKLRINRKVFDELMCAPIRHYSEFPNWEKYHRALKVGQSTFTQLTGKALKVYS